MLCSEEDENEHNLQQTASITMGSASAIATAVGPIKSVHHVRLIASFVLVCWVFPAVVSGVDVQDVVPAEDAAAIFSCAGRAAGYYADLQSGCQKYHMCDVGGRIYTYSCPNRTLFQQRVMICDHWFMVDCSLSQNYFSMNLLIGQKKPFVSDNEEFYRRNQEESTLHRRNQQKTPVDQSKTTSRGTTGTTTYPWRRRVSTSTTAAVEVSRGTTKDQSQIKIEDNDLSLPFGARRFEDKVAFTKSPLIAKKAEAQFVVPVKKDERTLPKEYANNPFFKSDSVAPTQASLFTTHKGQSNSLTTPSSIRKDHQNVFVGSIHNRTTTFTSTTPRTLATTASTLSTKQAVNTFSTTTVQRELPNALPNYQQLTPTVITTKTPSTSPGHRFVTPQGQTNQFVNDLPELRNTFSNGIANGDAVTEPPRTTPYEFLKTEARFNAGSPVEPIALVENDLGVYPLVINTHDEDLSANTVELRIPDTRHMFYIPDSPSREAEMKSSNNETVLTVSLSGAKHHGAMKFKGSRYSKGRNDDCPQCHPAFLLPGKCQPCVLIR